MKVSISTNNIVNRNYKSRLYKQRHMYFGKEFVCKYDIMYFKFLTDNKFIRAGIDTYKPNKISSKYQSSYSGNLEDGDYEIETEDGDIFYLTKI